MCKAPGIELGVPLSSHLHSFVDAHMILGGIPGGHHSLRCRGVICTPILWERGLKLEEVILCESGFIVPSKASATAYTSKKFICARCYNKYFTRYFLLCGSLPEHPQHDICVSLHWPLLPAGFYRDKALPACELQGPALPRHAGPTTVCKYLQD